MSRKRIWSAQPTQDWTDRIDVSSEYDMHDHAAVQQALHRLTSDIPEFQEVLAHTQSRFTRSHPFAKQRKILVRPEIQGRSFALDEVDYRQTFVNPSVLAHVGYRSRDGEVYSPSLNHVLLHSLLRQGDPVGHQNLTQYKTRAAMVMGLPPGTDFYTPEGSRHLQRWLGSASPESHQRLTRYLREYERTERQAHDRCAEVCGALMARYYGEPVRADFRADFVSERVGPVPLLQEGALPQPPGQAPIAAWTRDQQALAERLNRGFREQGA